MFARIKTGGGKDKIWFAKIRRYERKSWLAQMKGWKDKILFAKIQRCQKITDGLQKIKRYKTASKTYTTETAHQAERMHDHDVSWKVY